MSLSKRLWKEQSGQGLVEYTLVILLVAMVFWLGVRDTNIGTALAASWLQVTDCLMAPFSCGN